MDLTVCSSGMPSSLATSAVGTDSVASRSSPSDSAIATATSAIARRYSRSPGVARSNRLPKKPTASSDSASGAAPDTSAAVIGEPVALSHTAFP